MDQEIEYRRQRIFSCWIAIQGIRWAASRKKEKPDLVEIDRFLDEVDRCRIRLTVLQRQEQS